MCQSGLCACYMYLCVTVGPEEVDVVEFQDYLDKLLNGWNLDTIVVLLKCFRRLVDLGNLRCLV